MIEISERDWILITTAIFMLVAIVCIPCLRYGSKWKHMYKVAIDQVIEKEDQVKHYQDESRHFQQMYDHSDHVNHLMSERIKTLEEQQQPSQKQSGNVAEHTFKLDKDLPYEELNNALENAASMFQLWDDLAKYCQKLWWIYEDTNEGQTWRSWPL